MRQFYAIPFLFLFYSVVFFNELGAQGVYQLWGSTPFGGQSGVGNIFSVDSTGNNFRNRYSIPAINHGSEPYFAKLLKWDTKYYGYTEANSVLFEWDPVTNIYVKKFDLAAFELWGNGNLALKDDKIYGMAASGGHFDGGVIFEWDPATNIFIIKFHLSEADGYAPEGGLTLYNNKFYGLTSLGGINDGGVIFEWDPVSNVFTKKVDLPMDSYPRGDLILENGKFYGLIEGTRLIFEWNPITNTYTEKTDLNLIGVVSLEGANLVFNNGKFYASCSQGGNSNGGFIFEWDTLSNICTKRKDFDPVGLIGKGALTFKDGKFYGVTQLGGVTNEGILFEWDPVTNDLVKKVDFSSLMGAHPMTALTLDVSGKFYGLTSKDFGTIYEWDPIANIHTKKIDFNADVIQGAYLTGQLAYNNGRFYGVTGEGGINHTGVLFEWQPGNNNYSKKRDFLNTVSIGAFPISGVSVKDGKVYGGTILSDNNMGPSTLFEWDPVTDNYSTKISTSSLGFRNNAELQLMNGKYYGLLKVSPGPIIFEWDPVSNNYSEKFNIGIIDALNMNASLSAFNGKFYGLVSNTPAIPEGFLFEWDPVTNIYVQIFLFTLSDGYRPFGNLVEKNGLLYGTTTRGGANDAGVIFEWNPVNNVYAKRFDLSTSAGSNPMSGLTVSGNNFFGTTREGGQFNKGVVFEWDPATNNYTVKHHFNGLDGLAPVAANLIRVPAPIAPGNPGSCVGYSPIFIDNGNNTKWVALTDENGDVVAEINANGNNLGIVNYDLYVHNGPVREDGLGKLYLDRNITITPQTQPSTPVTIRMYITEAEFQALRIATNSQGQPSGVNTINDVGFFKNGNSCTSFIQSTATIVPATGEPYAGGYVLTASISSFSSFYFANKLLTVLPLTLLEFGARFSGQDIIVDWQTENEVNTKEFTVERSDDGINYLSLAQVPARGNNTANNYRFIDRGATTTVNGKWFYRLRMDDYDGRVSRSRIVILSKDGEKNRVLVYPNPVKDIIGITTNLSHAETLQVKIFDNSGRLIVQRTMVAGTGSSALSLNVYDLAQGVYYIEVTGKNIRERISFVKQ